ncbi:MAG: RNA polymerase sporulation sigma factor SigK [Clostridia bacterium]|nr:RNA polymerase sporulation sigma factor SigK [Clostridia bacterium]
MLFSSRLDTTHSFPHPLSPEKEAEYLKKYKEEGDIEARNILIKHNLRLVVFIAKKYVNYPDPDELVSIGTMGLMKAVNSFDTAKGSQLATYASRCIENEILMTMRSYKKRAQDVSIYDSVGSDKDGNDIPIIDLLQTEEEDVYKRLDGELTKRTLFSLIDKYLTEREKDIIVKRYGLKGGEPKTQQMIADEMGISRSYISRIEKKALLKLKEGFSREKILPY